jgi:hypothetical protein
VQEGAVQLLCTIITYFPSSMHRHYDSVSFSSFVPRLPSIRISIVYISHKYFTLHFKLNLGNVGWVVEYIFELVTSHSISACATTSSFKRKKHKVHICIWLLSFIYASFCN